MCVSVHLWRPEDSDWAGYRPTTWVLVIKRGSSCLLTSALTPFEITFIICVCGGGQELYMWML